MSEIRYVAKFLKDPFIGVGLDMLENREVQDDFCDRLLDFIGEQNPRTLGTTITKSEVWAGFLVIPNYRDEAVGRLINVVYRVHVDVITIYMVQVARNQYEG